ncbi:MAG: radical SAM protein, partial [Armatimonadetes bacterium]|nr:radical SAM protein [Armatimonadota bacterium]
EHAVHVMDPNATDTSEEAIEREVRAFGPDVVGITALTHNVVDVHRMALLARRVNPDAHVVLGGPHIVEFPNHAIQMSGVDSVVTAMDPEPTLSALIDAVGGRADLATVPGINYKTADGEVKRNQPPPANKNIDDLPFPDRQALDLRRFYTPGMRESVATTAVTSRGCPQPCHFCMASRSFRLRSPANIVDEMEECLNLGIKEIHYIDDIFNAPAKRVTAIADEILARKVKMSWGFKAIVNATTREMLERAKEAGCVKAHFGVETGTEEGLQSLGKTFIKLEDSRRVFKWCKELGMKSCAYIMLGIPWEKSRDDIKRTVDFVNELDPDFVVYALMSPYPGTPLWKKGAELGLWESDLWDRFLINPSMEHDHLPTVWTEHMSKEELFQVFKEVNREFYFNPRKLLKTLLDIQSLAQLKRIFFGGVGLIRLQLLNAKTSI